MCTSLHKFSSLGFQGNLFTSRVSGQLEHFTYFWYDNRRVNAGQADSDFALVETFLIVNFD
jgi:hypothetical protein